MKRIFHVLFIFQWYSTFSFPIKSKLTLEKFFDSTAFSYLSYSPTGQHLLIKTVQASWNTSSYEHILWIYDLSQQTRKVISRNPHKSIRPVWSPNGKWILLALDSTSPDMKNPNPNQRTFTDFPPMEQEIYLYSLLSNDLIPISIGRDVPIAFTWSRNDSTFYLVTTNLPMINDDEEWRDVLQYREEKKYEQSAIHQVHIHDNYPYFSTKRNFIRHVPFLINEIIYVPIGRKLLFTSISLLVENIEDFELYSIDLQDPSRSSLIRLTDNAMVEVDLQLSIDGIHVLYQTNTLGSIGKGVNQTQPRLHSVNVINGQITRLAKNFYGDIEEYNIRSDGGVYILGQIGTEIQVYFQQSASEEVIPIIGWNGTYECLTLSKQDFLAFVHSSTEKAMEVYVAMDIEKLQTAQPITNENEIFAEYDLPRTKVYRWQNPDDQRLIEGILHYPPGRFEAKNLPLFVLIHGGPYAGSVNRFHPDWYTWAPLAASEGWLVLEPNYRGSSGYGDGFRNEIRSRPLSLPGKDILYGIDRLVRDGIVDPYRLAVGGYSYGGFLTNWLITQTTRFNAALSGASAIEHLSSWGMMDLPVLFTSTFGGYPWEVPHIYQNEAPMYQLDRVRTPTLITTGEQDIRVPSSQSYILERALYYRGVPVKLITFPNEGHQLSMNPWHGRIKVREELKWLRKYGHRLWMQA